MRTRKATVSISLRAFSDVTKWVRARLAEFSRIKGIAGMVRSRRIEVYEIDDARTKIWPVFTVKPNVCCRAVGCSKRHCDTARTTGCSTASQAGHPGFAMRPKPALHAPFIAMFLIARSSVSHPASNRTSRIARQKNPPYCQLNPSPNA